MSIESLVLWSPQSYKDSTVAAREIICNGAGPKQAGWAVPDTLYGLNINPAANIHDWQYSESHTNDQRLQADLTFLRNMIVLIMLADLDANWFQRRLTYPRLCRAVKYFHGVWRFGGHFASLD